MTYNSQKYYLHYDQVGSLRAVTDISHNIVKEITYDTYGNILTETNPSFKVPFGFAGGLYDTDTKLTRFGYRDYDAYTGKWTAKDPIGFSGGDSNLYGYVLGDPVNFVDPLGLWWFWGDNNESLSKEEAEAANEENRGYGGFFDRVGHETGQKGIDIIDDRNYKHYKACVPALGKKRCKDMYPHEERKDKKDKKETSCSGN